jgi:hypothetical protein
MTSTLTEKETIMQKKVREISTDFYHVSKIFCENIAPEFATEIMLNSAMNFVSVLILQTKDPEDLKNQFIYNLTCLIKDRMESRK